MTYLIPSLLSPKVTLTFTIPSAGFTTDAATGNQIPNSNTITADAHLQRPTPQQRKQVEELAGMDNIRYPVWAIFPCCLDEAIRYQEPCIATCTYSGMAGTIELFPQGLTGFEAQVGDQMPGVFRQG